MKARTSVTTGHTKYESPGGLPDLQPVMMDALWAFPEPRKALPFVTQCACSPRVETPSRRCRLKSIDTDGGRATQHELVRQA
jgi:hypothetical protein